MKKEISSKTTRSIKKDIKPENAFYDAYKWLMDTFPRAFTVPSKIKHPLKLDIREDIFRYISDSGVVSPSKKTIRKVLGNYVRRPKYLKAIQVGSSRIDLSGQECGTVSEEEANYANEQVALMRENKPKFNQRI